MKAAQFHKPLVLQVIDQPLRALREEEVLVQVAACGVCGTDVHIVAGEAPARPPVILGHEFASTIAQNLGADLVLDPLEPSAREEIVERTHGGCDAVMECVGKAEAAEAALALTKRGSRVLLFGLASHSALARLPLQAVFRKELSIIASILNPFTFQRAVDLLVQNKITFSSLTINCFSLEQIAGAVESARNGMTTKTLVLPRVAASY